jgi:hypothetical protein
LREHRDEFRHVDAHVVLVCQSGSRAAFTAGAIVLTSLALPAASAVARIVDVGLVVAAAPARGRSAIDGDNASDDGHADNETTL